MASVWVLTLTFDDGMQGDKHTIGIYDSEEKAQAAKSEIITNNSATATKYDNDYYFGNSRGFGYFSMEEFQLNNTSDYN
jgi:hypothetical protein